MVEKVQNGQNSMSESVPEKVQTNPQSLKRKAISIVEVALIAGLVTCYIYNDISTRIRTQKHREQIAAMVRSENTKLSEREAALVKIIKQESQKAAQAIELDPRMDNTSKTILENYNFHLRETERLKIQITLDDAMKEVRKYDSMQDIDDKNRAVERKILEIETDTDNEYNSVIRPLLSGQNKSK